jgi:hypothetical protein
LRDAGRIVHQPRHFVEEPVAGLGHRAPRWVSLAAKMAFRPAGRKARYESKTDPHVMPGLVLPCAGHPRLSFFVEAKQDVDGRDKPGHDDENEPPFATLV